MFKRLQGAVIITVAYAFSGALDTAQVEVWVDQALAHTGTIDANGERDSIGHRLYSVIRGNDS